MSGNSWQERDLKLDERKSHSKANLEVVVQNHNQICDRRPLMHYSHAAVVQSSNLIGWVRVGLGLI